MSSFDVVLYGETLNSAIKYFHSKRSYTAIIAVGCTVQERDKIYKSGLFCNCAFLPFPPKWNRWPRDYIVELKKLVRVTNKRKEYFFRGTDTILKSVAVWDLDDTLIDKDGNVLVEAALFNKHCASFDCNVLWSHGNTQHVEEHVRKLCQHGIEFDYIISRTEHDTTDKKGGGVLLHYLNQHMNIHGFKELQLIDDLGMANACDQYTSVIQVENGNLNHLLHKIHFGDDDDDNLECDSYMDDIPIVESDEEVDPQ